jgi:enoyl-[acyl-carrier protein] reductase II
MNRLLQLLEIKYPIIEGGMAYIGDGKLAAAVSNAGGLGQVGSAGRTIEDFAYQIQVARTLTTNPIGVNLPIGEHRDPKQVLDVILNYKNEIQAVSLSAGNPKPYIQMLRNEGLHVLVVVSTPLQAEKAADAGASAVIVEGTEAGGHNGPSELSTLTLVPTVAKYVHVPVVAAVGIVDGRTFAAALVLGADGVQLGTRLVATEESCAHPAYKQALVEAKSDQTVILERSIGRSTRVLRAPYSEQILEVEKKCLTPEQLYPYMKGALNRVAALEGDLNHGYAYASQGIGLIEDIPTVHELFQRMVSEAKNAFGQLQNAFWRE